MPIYSRKKGHGFPVVFIHGFCETSEVWETFLECLPVDIESVAIDLPGFGRSSLDPNLDSIDKIAAEVHKSILRNEFAQTPVLVGHSLGGYVALSLVHQFPQSYSGLALFHSTSWADTPEKKENRSKVMDFVRTHGVAAFVSSFVPPLFHRNDRTNIDFATEMALKTPENTLLAYTQAMRDRSSREDVLRDWHCPMMLIAGQFDSVIPLNALEKQADLSSSIQLAVLPDVGHMGMLEAKNESANVVRDFILKVKTQAES